MKPHPLECRTWNSGLRTAGENVGLDRALLAAAPALRFCRYPMSAALGAHEQSSIAVRQEYCRQQGIEVVRRATGGGALYLDPSQLCWSLALPADELGPVGLAEVLERHGQALVAALQGLGIAARFVFPNDIEANGRKIACSFAGRKDSVVLVQGSLLITPPDAESMLKILRVPTEKLSKEGVWSARQRLTSVEEASGEVPALEHVRQVLGDALADVFGLRLTPEPEPTPIAERLHPAAPSPADAMKAFVKTDGGAIHAELQVDDHGRIETVSLSGAVQFSPSDLFERLAASVRGCTIQDFGRSLRACFDTVQRPDLLGFTLQDVQQVMALASARRGQELQFGFDREQSNTLMVHAPEGTDATSILERATVMLVPYCAKPPDCKFRHRDGCSECGKCEVGDAYRMARERGLRVVTITNFEHLQTTLSEMQADKVPAYVGMCCENFYLKRNYAFQQAGIPAVLTDISGTTCYELREEDLAYAGTFKAEAKLKLDVVEKVMQFVPTLPGAGRKRRKAAS